MIENLKKKAEQKGKSTAFLDDLRAREKAWKTNSEAISNAAAAAEGGETNNNPIVESSDSSELDYSVELSDIKSENESVYWRENRGNVEFSDLPIGNDKLFDHDFLNEFKSNLVEFERRVMKPHLVLNEQSMSGSRQGGKRSRRIKNKNRRSSAAGQN